MALRKLKLRGLSKWAKVFAENRDLTGYKPSEQVEGSYEKYDGACTIDVIMDEDNYKRLQASKSMKVGKEDPEGNGIKVNFDRKFNTGHDWSGGPPIVVKADNTPWDYSIDGNIGNGSTVEIDISVYDIKTYGSVGTRLEKVKVLDHVEYIQPQDDGDTPPSTKKPTSKSDGDNAEVLF